MGLEEEMRNKGDGEKGRRGVGCGNYRVIRPKCV
jgi:hypothetical protein